MWLANEFRAVVLGEDKDVVAFVPRDEDGERRTGMTVRFHDGGKTAAIVGSWVRTIASVSISKWTSTGRIAGTSIRATRKRFQSAARIRTGPR